MTGIYNLIVLLRLFVNSFFYMYHRAHNNYYHDSAFVKLYFFVVWWLNFSTSDANTRKHLCNLHGLLLFLVLNTFVILFYQGNIDISHGCQLTSPH